MADVESALRDGRAQAGGPLPTVRSLATSLGLSPTTVAAAYRELRLRGIATGNGRAGTRISAAPPVGPRRPLVVPDGVRSLVAGSPDPTLLPPLPTVGVPRRLYGDAPVSERLGALAAAALDADGIDATHLAVVGGALDGIERALGAWLRPGDRVAVEDPGYTAVLDLVAAMSFVVVPIETDGGGARPESLARALADGADAVVLTPRAQNPTGAAWDTARADALRAVMAHRPDTLVVEDDHAGPVAGAPARTICRGHGRWAALRSVSKSLGPDLRLAVMAGDAATVARVEGRQALGTGWVSFLLQETVAALWSDPATDALLARAATVYGRRRRALRRALAERGMASWGDSGLTVWVPLPDEVGTTTALLERGWAVAPGARFRIRSGPGIRVGIATLDEDGAPAFADALAASATLPARRAD